MGLRKGTTLTPQLCTGAAPLALRNSDHGAWGHAFSFTCPSPGLKDVESTPKNSQ